MNAELALCNGKKEKIAVMSAHLRRAHGLIDAETREHDEHPAFHHDDKECIAEAEAVLSNCDEHMMSLRRLR